MQTEQNGWVKLHRKIEEWGWYTDSKSVHLFIHLLIKANHKPKKWRGMDVRPGQFITSRERLSSETGISPQSIRTILERLKSTSEITSESTSKFTLITICNWDTYQTGFDQISQPINQVTNKPSTSNQPAINQQLTTNKNEEKEEKNKNEEKNTQKNEPESLEVLKHDFCFADMIPFLSRKTAGTFVRAQGAWQNAAGELKANVALTVDLKAIFDWATVNYESGIAGPMKFVEFTWPNILAAYEKRPENWYSRIKT